MIHVALHDIETYDLTCYAADKEVGPWLLSSFYEDTSYIYTSSLAAAAAFNSKKLSTKIIITKYYLYRI